MTLNRLAKYLVGAFAVALLVLAPACGKKGPEEPQEFKDITQKVGEMDKLSQKQSLAGQEQARKLKEAGVTDVKPGETMQLTDEQKKALEERIKAEKNSSYQALLQEVLDKDKEIKDLNEKIVKLRAQLPKPDMAKEATTTTPWPCVS